MPYAGMKTSMQAFTAASCIVVRLPCGHQRARLPNSDPATRRCRTCRHYFLIEYSTGGWEAAAVTDISCRTCLGELDSMGDMWTCTRCGDEFDDQVIRA